MISPPDMSLITSLRRMGTVGQHWDQPASCRKHGGGRREGGREGGVESIPWSTGGLTGGGVY